ncbi:hypothetical protein F1880_004340 [Penicillium rolfsii]|nr:hypothetical protein F1880_004340 [Penicillium rolfsii]
MIGCHIVQTAPMREQSASVFAPSGRPDLGSQRRRFKRCSPYFYLGRETAEVAEICLGTTRKRKQDHIGSGRETPKSPLSNCPVVTSDESTHHAEQARVIIQCELEGNERMNRERQAILKSALEFVNSIAQGTDSTSDDDLALEIPQGDCPGTPESIEPTPELLYMLIRESTPSTHVSNNMQWPDHISNKALQKMAAKFFEGNLTGQKFYQYCICIYMRAIFHTINMPRLYNDSAMTKQFLKSKRLYVTSALHALQNLNILNTPSLSHIQALIAATFLMLFLGNMSQAWVFNSYAARLIAALNYHDIQAQNRAPDLEEEINSSVYWCFYLDRTLSSLLRRPFSLPELHSPASDLMRWNDSVPHMQLVRVLVDLAQVQGDLSSGCKGPDTRHILDYHSKLQGRMDSIYSSFQSIRASAPEPISFDWMAIEFAYYAILVDILRSRLKFAFSPLTHRECVSCSRKALKALQYLQHHLAKSPGFVDPYPTFLTWTVFLYPLSPFFVLFCSIIGEVDVDDYHLIQDITQYLSEFDASPYIAKLLRLLDTLQHLCEPLILTKQHLCPQAKVAPWYPATTEEQQASMAVSDGSVTLRVPYMNPLAQSYPQPAQQDASGEIPPVADELMWHLFNSQPSLQWCDSDIIPLDPTANY